MNKETNPDARWTMVPIGASALPAYPITAPHQRPPKNRESFSQHPFLQHESMGVRAWRERGHTRNQTPPPRGQGLLLAFWPTPLMSHWLSLLSSPDPLSGSMSTGFFLSLRRLGFFFDHYESIFISYLHSMRSWESAISQGVETAATMNHMC